MFLISRKRSKSKSKCQQSHHCNRPNKLSCIIIAALLICFLTNVPAISEVIIKKINQIRGRPTFVPKPLLVESSNILATNDFDNPQLRKAIYRIVSSQSIVITGMVKDGEPDLLGTLLQIEKFSCYFKETDIVILTNNNKDNTTFLLNVWTQRPIHCDYKNTKLAKEGKAFESNKHILSFSDLDDPAPSNASREDKFVFYRNYVRDFVIDSLLSSKPKGFLFDYWAMIDFDVQAIETHRIFIEFCIASQLLNVDVFCVNGMEWTGRYRGSFATIFEDGQWCYRDGGQCSEIIQLNRFTQVRSCFGGLSIYNFAKVYHSECRYYTKADLQQNAVITHEWFKGQGYDDICEHIAFHDCLYSKNENLVMAISRDSYLYYGFAEYTEWTKEQILFSSAA